MTQFIVTMRVLVEAATEDEAISAVTDAYYYGLDDSYGKNDVNMRYKDVSAEKCDA